MYVILFMSFESAALNSNNVRNFFTTNRSPLFHYKKSNAQSANWVHKFADPGSK